MSVDDDDDVVAVDVVDGESWSVDVVVSASEVVVVGKQSLERTNGCFEQVSIVLLSCSLIVERSFLFASTIEDRWTDE